GREGPAVELGPFQSARREVEEGLSAGLARVELDDRFRLEVGLGREVEGDLVADPSDQLRSPGGLVPGQNALPSQSASSTAGNNSGPAQSRDGVQEDFLE